MQMDYHQKNTLLSFADYMSKEKNEGGHIYRVFHITRVVASILRLNKKYTKIISPESVEMLAYASLLHDVGKLYISDLILNKPGRLSPQEYEIVKTHINLSDRLISMLRGAIKNEDVFFYVCEIIKFHHENYDGSGYQKLSGEAIPVSARIVSIADTYDALRSDRPYKKAYSHSDAMKILIADRGKKFFPEVIDAFVEGQHKIRALYLKK